MTKAKEPKNLSLFISHRHIDKRVADVFRTELTEWAGNRISIYQSSNATTASRIASDLDDAIADAIAGSNMVLLIYTEAPGDMDWCMYECGLAQDPVTRETHVGVFHTTDEPPDPLDGLVSMRLSHDSVLSFVNGVHHDPAFFPRLGEALLPDTDEETVRKRATELFRKLKHASPEKSQEVSVNDRITISVPYALVDKIKELGEEKGVGAAVEMADTELQTHSEIRAFSGDPQEHFNYDELTPEMHLGMLIHRWQVDTGIKPEDCQWSHALYESITLAILNRPEKEIARPFASLAGGGNVWLLPALARYRTLPYERVYEFDILFIRLSAPAAEAMLEVSR